MMWLRLREAGVVLLSQVDGAQKEQPGLIDVVSRLALPIGGIIVLYIFLMVLPNRRDQKKKEEFLAGIKKNDEVVLHSGIVATVINAAKDQPIISVRIDESTNTKMRVLRSSVVRVLKDDDDPAASDKG